MTNAPTSFSVMIHTLEAMDADCSPDNGGAVNITGYKGGWETTHMTIFTGCPELCVELAAVINAALAKHNRLKGAIKHELAQAAE